MDIKSMKFKLIALFFSLLITQYAHADQSMRRCMLLPINDPVGGAIGYEIFNNLEKYLQTSDWCYYRSNSPIIDILSNYRANLHDHLQNPEVLRVIAERTLSGSLIKVAITKDVSRLQVKMEIIGSNGEDIYFSEEQVFSEGRTDLKMNTLRGWLEEYKQEIPYDGRVLGVLGDQFTFEVGSQYGVEQGQTLEVVRVAGMQRHPLLGEVVNWETTPIAAGEVIRVSANQSEARVRSYYRDGQQVQTRDWVILRELPAVSERPVSDGEDEETRRHGQLGTVGFSLGFGRGTWNSNIPDETRKMKGTNIGGQVNGEVWVTRNYWAGLEIGRYFSSYKPETGDFKSSSNSLSRSLSRVKLGYKYLPLGFFYGPQVDAYIGYARYGYGFDNNLSDSITAVSYSGLLLGTRASVPIQQSVRVHLDLDFIFRPSFSEDENNFGGHHTVRNYHLTFGGLYQYSQEMSFNVGLDFLSNRTKFHTGEDLSLQNTTILIGAQFTY